MNDNIESKLNELLKMKDDLDELKGRRKQQETVDDFAKKQRTLKIYYYVWLFICCFALLLPGIVGMQQENETHRINGLFVALVGLNSTILMKLWYFIKESKLAMLQELKQLRIQLANQLPSNKV